MGPQAQPEPEDLHNEWNSLNCILWIEKNALLL